jgi:phosphoribosylformylglycinamidine synthase
MYKASIHVTLRPSILDPQGKATRHALEELGYEQVRSVRIGKYIELQIDADSEAAAHRLASEACSRLLSNPVREDFSIQLEPLTAETT